MDRDVDLIPSSPSNSSLSSSDLDTESTGSFFPDRSTTLGTLMGVHFPHDVGARPARAPSRREHSGGGGDGRGRLQRPRPRPGPAERRRQSGARGGRRWWRLCRDDMAGVPTSLGDFLQVERRLGDAAGDVVLAEGPLLYGPAEEVGGAAARLFEDGWVLPPAAAAEGRRRGREGVGSLGRLPVLLTGICSGGEG